MCGSKFPYFEGVPVGLAEMDDVVQVAGNDLISSCGSPDHDHSIDDVRNACSPARSPGRSG